MIQLSEEIQRRIELHGEQAYPEECCGILLGFEIDGTRRVEEIAGIDNRQDENRRRRFLITPDQYRQAEQAAMEKNMLLLGFYHSHPDHPAIPSTFDREHALPWFDYVIVSIQNGKATGMASWLLNEDRSRFLQNEIIIAATLEQSSQQTNDYRSRAELRKTKP